MVDVFERHFCPSYSTTPNDRLICSPSSSCSVPAPSSCAAPVPRRCRYAQLLAGTCCGAVGAEHKPCQKEQPLRHLRQTPFACPAGSGAAADGSCSGRRLSPAARRLVSSRGRGSVKREECFLQQAPVPAAQRKPASKHALQGN